MSDERFIKKTLDKKLTEAQRLALVIIAEEAAELGQAATKALRFGLTKFNPFDMGAGDNLTQLRREAQDVIQSVERFEATLVRPNP